MFGQVSTRRGRACMDVVGCFSASEQLVQPHISMPVGATWRKLLKTGC